MRIPARKKCRIRIEGSEELLREADWLERGAKRTSVRERRLKGKNAREEASQRQDASNEKSVVRQNGAILFSLLKNGWATRIRTRTKGTKNPCAAITPWPSKKKAG